MKSASDLYWNESAQKEEEKMMKNINNRMKLNQNRRAVRVDCERNRDCEP